ncbi:calcium-binding protein [Novosphingobium guangzhouense]|uniref:Calcium-binding protein n=1 Tax=Novosphingobium guangzhouense TaxID=1850347 RepID=A0A2K2G144_9SPHN|nr:calcium-binding protein [Novosphingobium guangzhouense]PNU04775.1 calcium-binding protein [Novosphingobium guangzhouense]
MTDAPFPLTRRAVIGGLAAAPLLSPAALAQGGAISRFMVQGRPQDTGSPYKLANILPALNRLGGVRRMRCREPYRGTPGWATYVGLARAGVKFCFTLSVRAIPTTIGDLKAFLAAAPGSIWAIEYPNEPDLNPVTYKGITDKRLGFRTGNAPALMAFIRDFHKAIKADRALSALPLIASNDFMQAQQGPYCDMGNSHIYPAPASDTAARLAGFRTRIAQGGHRQGVITEWGRTTGGGASNVTSPPVTLDQQARLLASDVRAALARPFVHTINIYELFSWQGRGEMTNFGLFNNDFTPRPAVAAIRAVLKG